MRDLAVSAPPAPPAPAGLDVAEPIAAEPHARVQDDAVADLGPGVAHDVRIHLDLVAHHHAVAEDAAAPEPDIAAEADAAPQDHVRPDRDRILPGAAPADDRGGMHARLPDGLGVEHGKDGEQRHLGVRDHDADRGPFRFRGEFLPQQHDRGCRAPEVREIAGSGQKREVARLGALERGDPGDAGFGRPHQPAARQGRDFARGQGVGGRGRGGHGAGGLPTAPVTGAAARGR